MMVNLDVNGCTTKTLNHQKLLRKTRKRLLKTKRILKPKHKLSWGPSFTFTVACRRGQFTPLAAAGRPKHSKNFHWQIARGEKFWRYLPLTRSFQVCHQKYFSLLHHIGIQLIPVEFWSRPHQWCQAAGAPLPHRHQWMQWMMGRCLQTSEDAQKSCGTYKISTTSLVHTCACVFCFSWEFGNVCHRKGFWEKSSNCFRREKTPKCGNIDNQLFNKLNISGVFLLLLSPNARHSKGWDIQVVEVLHYVSQKSNRFSLSFPKKAENALASLHIWLTSRKKTKRTKISTKLFPYSSIFYNCAQVNLYNCIVLGKKRFHRYFLAFNPLFPPG